MANPFKVFRGARAALFGKHKIIPRQLESASARAKIMRTLGTATIEGLRVGGMTTFKLLGQKKGIPGERIAMESARRAFGAARQEFTRRYPRRRGLTAGIGEKGGTVGPQVDYTDIGPEVVKRLASHLGWWQRRNLRRVAHIGAPTALAGLYAETHGEHRHGGTLRAQVGPVGVSVGERGIALKTPKGAGGRTALGGAVTWKGTEVLHGKGSVGVGHAAGFGHARTGSISAGVHLPIAKLPVSLGGKAEWDKQFTEKRRSKRLQKLRQTVMGDLPLPVRY